MLWACAKELNPTKSNSSNMKTEFKCLINATKFSWKFLQNKVKGPDQQRFTYVGVFTQLSTSLSMELNKVVHCYKPGLANPKIWAKRVHHFWRIIYFSQTSLDFRCEESHRNILSHRRFSSPWTRKTDYLMFSSTIRIQNLHKHLRYRYSQYWYLLESHVTLL